MQYPSAMSQRVTNLLVIGGGLLAVLGAAAVLVYVFQPWRTCPGEDSSAGCSMLPQDATGMVISILVAAVGVVLFSVGMVKDRARAKSETPS